LSPFKKRIATVNLTEKKLVIDRVEPLLLYGFNDTHLRKIEAAFPSTQITARGNQVMMRGAISDVDHVERVLNELVLVLNRNKQLTDNDVETVLAVSTRGGSSLPPDTLAEDVILFTPNGGVIKAKTANQRKLVAVARDNDLVFAVGPAGTGKTYTAVALAVSALKTRQVKRIVLCRPAVEAGERLGFLPGDFRDKVDPYLRPLYDALEDMLSHDKLATYMEQHIVEIVPLAYMRGRTLNSAFVILDEAQNATRQQMKMFLTRLGANSRAIITGDVTQTDLPSLEQSGLVQAQHILEGVDGISFVHFNRTDVLRHRLVKDIIDAYERHSETQPVPPNGRH
jgi:phosphate starvation-inducible protein PhoH and related proteins